MSNYNHAVLMGHLTTDPEKRVTSAGKPVTNFTVAVNGFRSVDGEEEVLYMPCAVFGKTAETAGKSLGKGDPVLVDGRLVQVRWEQEGQKRSRTELRVFRLRFLKGKGPGAEEEGESSLEREEAR
jgi:single-strand DNA-binding protein